jgi:hypothetical protein
MRGRTPSRPTKTKTTKTLFFEPQTDAGRYELWYAANVDSRTTVSSQNSRLADTPIVSACGAPVARFMLKSQSLKRNR